MKKYIKIILVIVAVASVGGWFYWQQYKKNVVKDSIENAVRKGTDSLYFIRYDSSFIDEVNGNASFYHVDLQSNSLQRELLLYDTASAETIYNVHVDEVSIQGANIPDLLTNTQVQAKTILIKHPVVYIINAGKKERKLLSKSDSLLIYEKLLGRFNSINAGEISIEDGNLFFADKTGKPYTSLKNISVSLKTFEIDSTKNYSNIVSYFVKDVVAKVAAIIIQGDNNQATFTNVEYNAPGKFLRIKNFQQKNKEQQMVFDVGNTYINDISTDSFIISRQLRASEFKSDGGLLTFYRKETNDSARDAIEIDNNYFSEALVNSVSIGNTKIVIYNSSKPGDEPFVLNNVKFNATDIQKLHSGTSIRNLVSSSNWQLSADGFSFMSKDKRYKMNVGTFDINNGNFSMHIKSFSMLPARGEAAFLKSLTRQEDMYGLEAKNIVLTGIDTRLLLTQKKLEAAMATWQPTFKVYRDRTIASDLSSRVGKYPHQLLQKIDFPFNIKKIIVKDGAVTYSEKNDQSNKTGTVFFKHINGTITNVTNMHDAIKKSNLLVLHATTGFMGLSRVQTTWRMRLNDPKGTFKVSGSATGFSAPQLNPAIEPLGMISIKAGKVNGLTFSITGDNLGAKGSSVFLYEDLKVEMLKTDSADLKKKSIMTLLANALIKDKNPVNGDTRSGEIDYERDKTKSFFNLIWKAVFSGMKKTAQKL